MNPRLRRILIPLIVLAVSAFVVIPMFTSVPRQAPTPDNSQTAKNTDSNQSESNSPVSETESQDDSVEEPVEESSDAQSSPSGLKPAELSDLKAAAPDSDTTFDEDWLTLGSLDPRQDKLQIKLIRSGAGMDSITFAELWQVAHQTRAAEAHYDALKKGNPNPPPLPADEDRYVLQTTQPLQWLDKAGQKHEILIPLLSADTIYINGIAIRLLSNSDIWAVTGPGSFKTSILDENNKLIAQVHRTYVYSGSYDILLKQRITNHTDLPIQVQWVQYGPGDLIPDRSAYLDRRRTRFGYLPFPATEPDFVESKDNDVLFERSDIINRAEKTVEAQASGKIQREIEFRSLWPNKTSREKGYKLSWYASVNRYFSFAVHPVLDEQGQGSKFLENVIQEVRPVVSSTDDPKKKLVFTGLYSPVVTIKPGQETAFDLGVYAGPLDRHLLEKEQPYQSLRMRGMILYQMSSFCAICTFQWLGIFLLWFLSVVHSITFDWGLSIIILVCVVRTLLHPLTKKAQISMQRFGKIMGELKPEQEKLQAKYKNDPKKLQQEQMRLMKEHGANPMQLLGCLPMLLQTPIWIALYAMLYFAFDLRHQPALWGLFQQIGGWPFLADLSSADHFFWQFNKPFQFLKIWNITGINILPILMGVVFFIQQKYMTPPPSATTTKEQLQTQKIMKVMMVVMFPVMLYSAPSGLTLYIFTSSLIGIIEGRYIRAHIKEMDLNPPKPKDKSKGKAKGKGKPKDLQARAYADALARAKAKRKPKPKKYKKRD